MFTMKLGLDCTDPFGLVPTVNLENFGQSLLFIITILIIFIFSNFDISECNTACPLLFALGNYLSLSSQSQVFN